MSVARTLRLVPNSLIEVQSVGPFGKYGGSVQAQHTVFFSFCRGPTGISQRCRKPRDFIK